MVAASNPLVCPVCGERVQLTQGWSDGVDTYHRYVCPNSHEAARHPIHLSAWSAENAANQQSLIFADVADERRKQDGRWGKSSERNLPLPIWLTVLTEEVGEVAHEILVGAQHDDYTALRAELIQVAAVAVAMIEAIEGDSAPWGIEKGDAG